MRKLVIANADVMRLAIQQEIARSDESRVRPSVARAAAGYRRPQLPAGR